MAVWREIFRLKGLGMEQPILLPLATDSSATNRFWRLKVVQ
jgi:hypothetical protein